MYGPLGAVGVVGEGLGVGRGAGCGVGSGVDVRFGRDVGSAIILSLLDFDPNLGGAVGCSVCGMSSAKLRFCFLLVNLDWSKDEEPIDSLMGHAPSKQLLA